MGVKVLKLRTKSEQTRTKRKETTVEPVTEHLVSKIEQSWSHQSGNYEQEEGAHAQGVYYILSITTYGFSSSKHTIMYNPRKIIEDNTVNNVCARGLSGASLGAPIAMVTDNGFQLVIWPIDETKCLQSTIQ